MKPIQIHPLSALAGAGILGLVLLATSASQAHPTTFPANPFPVTVEGIPTPQQMMRVVEGQPFTVPAGKVFVLTGLGKAGSGGQLISFQVDGVTEVSIRLNRATGFRSFSASGLRSR